MLDTLLVFYVYLLLLFSSLTFCLHSNFDLIEPKMDSTSKFNLITRNLQEVLGKEKLQGTLTFTH